MVEQVTLEATPREGLGTRRSRKLRQQGRVPAVIYGHGETVKHVTVNRHDLAVALQHGARMLSLRVGAAAEQVLIKDVQYDYLGAAIIHADFTRISMDEKITLAVALHFRGTPQGVEAEDGVLTTPVSEIEIECLPGDIPAEIEVNVRDLGVGDSLTVADLTLPDGVTAVSEENLVLAQVAVVAEEEEAPAEEAEEAAEPEVIGAKEAEDEEAAAGSESQKP